MCNKTVEKFVIIHLELVLLQVHVLFPPFYSSVLKPDFDLRKAMYDLQLCLMLCQEPVWAITPHWAQQALIVIRQCEVSRYVAITTTIPAPR